ncbi:MAG TPA: serine hydrolase [Thermohalobaculum sp.]|nr:serine hydrolase [Thermohalobaculum sp.]
MPAADPAPTAPARGDATLANWRSRPHSAWAFSRVRELIPTAAVAAGRPAPLAGAPREVLLTPFADPAGAERTVGGCLAAIDADGLVMLRSGRLVAEHYFGGYDGRRPHILFSVSKSVTGLLVGILADRGLIDPDAPVTRLVPEVEGSAYGDCTVRHLLDMTVAVAFEEDYFDPAGDVIRYRLATGWNPAPPDRDPGDLRAFLATLRRDEGAHGEVFRYVSPNADLLGWLIERATGRPYAETLSGLLWQPMGAGTPADITVDRLGAPRAAGGISATVRDLARLGELVRRRGTGPRGQVVPAWWVEDIVANGDRAAWRRGSFAEQQPDGSYRSQWYRRDGGPPVLLAIGIHGQWLHIDMANESVIALVSSRDAPTDDASDASDASTMAMLDALARSEGGRAP